MGIIKNIIDAVQGKAPLGEKRSPQWPKVRAEHLKKNPTCAVCDGTAKLEVHHIVPFHIDSTKELEPTNLLTLCESKENGINCHLAFGHVGLG
jgi:5-methylcytosine-specific restriction enzyme A